MQQAVSERIKFVRKHYNLTQSKFAEGLKIKQSSVSAIEGGGNPDIETIINIGNVYKIDLNWLLTGKGNMLLGKGNVSDSELNEWIEKHDDLQRQLIQANEELLILYREKRKRDEDEGKLKKGA